jgi:hypothetical protein
MQRREVGVVELDVGIAAADDRVGAIEGEGRRGGNGCGRSG